MSIQDEIDQFQAIMDNMTREIRETIRKLTVKKHKQEKKHKWDHDNGVWVKVGGNDEKELIDRQKTQQDEIFNEMYPKLDNGKINEIVIVVAGWVIKGTVIKEDNECIYLTHTITIRPESQFNTITRLINCGSTDSKFIEKINRPTKHYKAHILWRLDI
jgi:hypothetical protein